MPARLYDYEQAARAFPDLSMDQVSWIKATGKRWTEKQLKQMFPNILGMATGVARPTAAAPAAPAGVAAVPIGGRLPTVAGQSPAIYSATGPGELKTAISLFPDQPSQLAKSYGISEDTLVLQIDRQMNERVWAGGKFVDRNITLEANTYRKLLGEIERSLGAQESYDEFRERILKRMGVSTKKVTGPLADLAQRAKTEARLAWNEGVVAANAKPRTVGVWLTQNDDRVTPYCAARHGKEIVRDLGGEMPLAHYGCFDSETRVLTDAGWRHFAELSGSERFMSMNPETHAMGWVPAANHIAYPYEGDMIHFKASSFDMLVTPNHQMAYVSNWKHGKKNNRIELKRADEMGRFDYIPRSGIWEGDASSTIEVAGQRYPTGAFMEFMGWFLSEGSVSRGKQIKITQHDEANRRHIQALVSELFGRPPGRGKSAVYYDNEPLARWLSALGHSHEKYIPQQLKNLSPVYLRRLLDACLKGDGATQDTKALNASKGGKWEARFKPFSVHYTSSLRLADDIAELILKCGGRPGWYRGQLKRKGRVQKFSNGEYVINHPCVAVAEGHRYWAMVQNMGKRVPYSGMVYCVELEKHHLLYVERNGRAAWAGNCRCMVFTVSDPQDGDEDWANGGKAVLSMLKKEQVALIGKPRKEAFQPSRFRGFRAGITEVQSADQG